MTGGAPARIAIEPDDYHAKHVGHTADGRQFFLTTPFIPSTDSRSGETFVALFLFDDTGRLIEAHIDQFGQRQAGDADRRVAVVEQRLRQLGDITYARIEIEPFAVERFGTTFGLIARPPEEDNDAWSVELHPGNYMAFYEPWDSGIYDT